MQVSEAVNTSRRSVVSGRWRYRTAVQNSNQAGDVPRATSAVKPTTRGRGDTRNVTVRPGIVGGRLHGAGLHSGRPILSRRHHNAKRTRIGLWKIGVICATHR